MKALEPNGSCSLLVKPVGPACNLACTYCFYRGKSSVFPAPSAPVMAAEVLEALTLRALGDFPGEVTFHWQGGEPTLAGLDFFRRALELQHRHGGAGRALNCLQTNGLLIDGEWVEFLARHHLLVGLSLDGPEDVHDRFRRSREGSGSWRGVTRAARRLIKGGVAVNALCVINASSVERPAEVYGFFKDLGIDHVQFVTCLEPDPSDTGKPASFSAAAGKLGDFLCRTFDLWLADFDEEGATTSIRIFDSLFHAVAGLAPTECTFAKECGGYLVVERSGDVFGCDFFVEPSRRLGNVARDSLAAMLASPGQRAFGRRKAALPPRCFDCRWLSYCRGGCLKDRSFTAGGGNYFCGDWERFFAHAVPRLERIQRKWGIGAGAGAAARSEGSAQFLPHPPGERIAAPVGEGDKRLAERAGD